MLRKAFGHEIIYGIPKIVFVTYLLILKFTADVLYTCKEILFLLNEKGVIGKSFSKFCIYKMLQKKKALSLYNLYEVWMSGYFFTGIMKDILKP